MVARNLSPEMYVEDKFRSDGKTGAGGFCFEGIVLLMCVVVVDLFSDWLAESVHVCCR